MGNDKLFWKRKNKPLKRKSRNKGEPLESFLIVCEGGKTEPNYFEAFRITSANVKIIGCGMNTLSLVKEADKLKQRYIKDGEIFDQVWCVFDKDDNGLSNFKAAFEFAEKNGIKIAYSNEAFELWYLLHFEYMDAAITRFDYIKKLSKHLNEPYKKSSPLIYKELLKRQADAIRNAEKLLNSYTPRNPSTDNPSTTVHRLVQELNKFISKG